MKLSRRAALARALLTTVAGGLFSNIRSAFANTAHYVYDERGRLVTVAYSDGTRTDYTYDAAGNRTQVVSGPTSASTNGTIVFQSDTPGDWRWTCARTQNYEVRIWGPGAAGCPTFVEGDEKSGITYSSGPGGGGGGYSARQYTIEFGDVLSGRVGAGGILDNGAESTTLTTYQGYALTANPGLITSGILILSAGGTATGGTTNISGRAGGLTNQTDGGGAGNGGGDQTTSSGNGTSPGGGGGGGDGSFGVPADGGSGAHGRVQIIAR